MTTLLVQNAHILATMDDHRRENTDGGLFIRDEFIEQIGTTPELLKMAADFFALNLNCIDYAGVLHDLVATAVFPAPVKANYTVVGGKSEKVN